MGLARAPRSRGADAFRGADRHPASDRLRGRAGADHRRGGAPCVVNSPSVSSKRGVMRNILITAAILAGLGTFMAQMADKFAPAPAAASSTIAKAMPVEMPAQAGVRSLNVARDAR